MHLSNRLPGILRWFEVVKTEKVQMKPVEVAIDTMERMNQELQMLVALYTNDSCAQITPFTMRLQGVIDAAVMGGIAKYHEVFRLELSFYS